jgi:putative ABC transport system permease protein
MPAVMVRDLRYSIRALRKTPAFTAGAIVTVALAVAATTAIFSVVYGVLLRQLPYRDAHEVFWIWSDQIGRDRGPLNVPDFIDYRDSTRALSGFAGFFAYGANLSDESAAERVQGIRATGNLFDVLGATPLAGRLLSPADERPDAAPVVVITEPFWKRRFGGDPTIVGLAIRLNGEPYTVVGILRRGFAMPVRDVEFVVPFAPDLDHRRGVRNSVNFIIGVGRLAAETPRAQAAGELNTIAKRLQERFPVENARKRGVHLFGAIDGIAGPFRDALLTIFAAVAAVLLIACANLANLMLTRATSRRKENAVRLALGASRPSVVRQVLIEALVVAIAGGAIGTLAAHWGVAAVMALAPAGLPRTSEIRVDATMLAIAVGVSTLTGMLFGLLPALASARVDMRHALQSGGRGASAGGRRLRGLLVSSEVALAVVLLIVVTMLAKSFANVLAVDPGFDPTGVLSARITLPPKRFGSLDAILNFQQALVDRLSAVPGVTGTGAITLVPLSGLIARVPFTVDGRPVERSRVPIAQYRTVSDGYFETARIPLTRGRTFTAHDTRRSVPVAIVNEALARQWLDGLEPIGARLLANDNDSAPRPLEIVGVVGNVRQLSLDGEQTWDLYLPYSQVHDDNVTAAANMFWLVRTAGDPAGLSATFARALQSIDSEVAASQVRPMADYLSDAAASRRFSVSLIALFALAALALAMTGIYAMVSYSLSERTREIGIRVALGASRRHIVGVVIGYGLSFVLIGLAAGVALAAGAARLLSSLLFGVTAFDPVTLGQAAAGIAAASLVACAVPAGRIGRTADIVVLQAE